MVRESVIVWSLVALLVAGAGFGPSVSATTESNTKGELWFESSMRHLAIDAPQIINPDIPYLASIGGPFAYDSADDNNAVPPDTQIPPRWEPNTDASVIFSWNVQNRTLYWTHETDRCGAYYDNVRIVPPENQTYTQQTMPSAFTSEYVVRQSMPVHTDFVRNPLEAHHIVMEDQLSAMAGWDKFSSYSNGIAVYGYIVPPPNVGAGPFEGHGGYCWEGDRYGQWVNSHRLGDGNTASMDLYHRQSGQGAFFDEYMITRTTGDTSGSTVENYHLTWSMPGGLSLTAANSATLTPIENQKVWGKTASHFGGDPCNGAPPTLDAQYEEDLSNYDGPLGTVHSRHGSLRQMTSSNDIEYLFVQDTTHKQDATTGKIDLYFRYAGMGGLFTGNPDHAYSPVLPNPGVEQWAYHTSIYPTSDQAWYPSTARSGSAFGTFNGMLAVIEHEFIDGKVRAFMYLYGLDDSVCDPNNPELPGELKLVRDKQRVSTEEFVPHKFIDGEDRENKFWLHSPKFFARVFDRDPYNLETLERDGVVSMLGLEDEELTLWDPDVHRETMPPDGMPRYLIVCPEVESVLTSGDLFWFDYSPNNGNWFGHAQVDFMWDNNQTLGPNAAHRYANDAPGFYYFDLDGGDGECIPPEIDIICGHDVSYDEDLNQFAMTQGDEDCEPNPQCENDDDCRTRKNVNKAAPPSGDGAAAEEDPAPYKPDYGNLSWERDYDGDGHPDAVDNCPFVANPDQLDDDGNDIGDACEGSSDSAGNPITPRNTESVLNQQSVADNGPGMSLWIALVVGAIIIALLVVVARRNNNDEE